MEGEQNAVGEQMQNAKMQKCRNAKRGRSGDSFGTPI